MFTGKALVYEQILFIVSHRISEVDIVDLPAMPLELVDYDPPEVLVVDGVVGTEGGGVVIEDDGLVAVVGVVSAEVVDERRNFALELREEGFDDFEGLWACAQSVLRR